MNPTETNRHTDYPIQRILKNPFLLATYALAAIASTLSLALLPSNPMMSIYAATIMLGWSETNGLCGASHVCSLTMLQNNALAKRIWLKAVAAYTIAGTITAMIVGGLTGFVGSVILDYLPTALYVLLGASILIALVLTARELKVLRFALPQVRRQTHKAWAFDHGFIAGAGMWGAHIGLALATVIEHGGLYLVIALSIALGPVHGPMLFAAFWIGRALPMWVAPSLARMSTGSSNDPGELLHDANMSFRTIAITGLLCIAIAIVQIAQFGRLV